MALEIITIGDEILSGNILDTNTAYLSDKLWRAGFEVAYHTGVRDDADKISEALLSASSRAQAVIVTGGMGPTADDFTIEVAAKAFGLPLVLDSPTLEFLKTFFAQRGRVLRENNKKQAYVPKGSTVYPNVNGTAPGVKAEFEGVPFYFLPGVPREMKGLFEKYVLPDLREKTGASRAFVGRFLKCFGVAESELDHQLKDLYDGKTSIENVRVGFRAHFPEIFIKLSAWGKTLEEAEGILKPVEDKVLEKVGEYVFGGEDDTLEAVTAKLLLSRGKTVATAESCTGGLIAHRLTNVPGSSGYFLGGVVAYANEVKASVLGVNPTTLEKHGAVSSECALEMARGIRRVLKSDFGIAVTGIAGPDGGTQEKPVGTVNIAIAHEQGEWEKAFHFPYGREMFKQVVSAAAIDRLRRILA